MEIRIDPRLENGIVQEGTGGTVSVSTENLITFTSTTGIVRKTRWFAIKPGETIVASVEMVGSSANNTSLNLYISSTTGEETLIGSVVKDSNSDMKLYKISYTLPMNSTAKMVGVAFITTTGIGKFYRPHINVINKCEVAPSLIACGLVTMLTPTINASFPSFGVLSLAFSGNLVIVTLKQLFRDNIVRPLIMATDDTHSSTPSTNKLVCSNTQLSGGGNVTFALYYVDTNGVVVPPHINSGAQFAVYY